MKSSLGPLSVVQVVSQHVGIGGLCTATGVHVCLLRIEHEEAMEIDELADGSECSYKVPAHCDMAFGIAWCTFNMLSTCCMQLPGGPIQGPRLRRKLEAQQDARGWREPILAALVGLSAP